MGARKLTDEEFHALHEPPLYERDTPICRKCGGITYPSAWCQCDPRDQVTAHLVAEAADCGVLLRPDDDEELKELSP